ncbi:MAG: hypothetical protein H6688_01635 [Erysipelotrichaceae bacterium]|nr:hypothetical protein [Erysipelotrichaceae bacterium]
MKVKKILIIATSTLLLSACTGNGLSAGSLPSGGEQATAASTLNAIGRAYDSLIDLDSFEANLNLKKTHLNVQVGETFMDEQENEVAGHNFLALDLSGKANFAAEGLTSSTLSDLKAAASIQNLSLSVAEGAVIGEETAYDLQLSQSGLDLAAYLSNGSGYIDASDAEFRSMVSTILGMNYEDSSQVEAIMESIPEKIMFEQVVSEELLPVLPNILGEAFDLEQLPTAEEVKESLGDVINDASLGALQDYVTLLDYEDGRFGIAVNLDEDAVVSLAGLLYSSLLDSSATSEVIEAFETEIAAIIDVDAIKLTILLNQDALLSDVLLDLDFTIDTSLSELIASEIDLYADVDVQTELTFKYGDDVDVVLPSDLDTYVSMQNSVQ